MWELEVMRLGLWPRLDMQCHRCNCEINQAINSRLIIGRDSNEQGIAMMMMAGSTGSRRNGVASSGGKGLALNQCSWHGALASTVGTKYRFNVKLPYPN